MYQALDLPWEKRCFYSTNEEIESQRGEAILLRSHIEQTIVLSNRSNSKVNTFFHHVR